MRGRGLWLVGVAWGIVACGGDREPREPKPCTANRPCKDGLVCLLGEDSLEGACYPAECAEHWTGYGCDTGLTETPTDDTGG